MTTRVDGRIVEDTDGRLTVERDVPARDRFVVCREPVAEVVQGFVSQWSNDHAPDSGRYAPNQQRTAVTQVRAYEYLAERTRTLDRVHGVGVPEKTLASMFRRNPTGELRYQTLDLRTADLLLTAVGGQHLFPHDGVGGGDSRLTPQRRGTRSCCHSLTGTVTPRPH